MLHKHTDAPVGFMTAATDGPSLHPLSPSWLQGQTAGTGTGYSQGSAAGTGTGPGYNQGTYTGTGQGTHVGQQGTGGATGYDQGTGYTGAGQTGTHTGATDPQVNGVHMCLGLQADLMAAQ